jgi:predicted nucleic acid-binding protein
VSVNVGFYFAPQLWCWEVGNILIANLLGKRIAPEYVEEAHRTLEAAQIAFDPTPDLNTRNHISCSAIQRKLSFYDASYLELVLRLNGHLASTDKTLMKAVNSCGIICLDF